ncbi:4-(cytidine 5'-diphospho)-2-C-methyl-D-erythritol kinase [Selenihalanaerobacter shriftii]|uniref:4-diphosphocytidyl-2-C-methyl-D-erythritol kinase n=1 Tax=Selenihalanaerobacter shriftii TaxID=142842 RepID=A0A1T4N5J4_9FIRM|nr:4-(cytidine 5'-diphospho)-2-C-methyl-D-erythritol kinase [Selenihalanaerobacter shriftii]SJZ74579.1 4-diphosphocytidyl-2-C-methyl-D-erythritol kinase [Selenihalanaerobacter shriftii]
MVQDLALTTQAKINLILDVVNRRVDGYHEVEMIMQSIDLADELYFTKIEEGIILETDSTKIPTGPQNLVYKAANLLFNKYNLAGGIKVKISKTIPVAAGLAGGSTNAAATLIAINKLWELNLTVHELRSLGAELGADVPFCIKGGTVLATGIGTELEPLKVTPRLDLVLVNPPFSVSTAEIYQSLDLETAIKHPNLDEMIQALKEEKKLDIIFAMDNLLTHVTMNRYEELKKLENLILEQGAKKVLMSGSGPTMLGFTMNKAAAEKLEARLRAKLPKEYVVKRTKTTSQGIIIK